MNANLIIRQRRRPGKGMICGGMTAIVIALLAGNLLADKPVQSPDLILVKPKAHLTDSDKQALFAAVDGQEEITIHQIGVHQVRVPAQNRDRILEALSHNPNVEFAEADEVLAADAVPSDPNFSSQWHLPKIAAPTAWDVTQGSSSVIIAILDSGVDATHPDLAANLVAGWNFYDNNADTSDVFGHGTKVAGSAAACGNNGVGVSGVSWNCKIMPVRVAGLDGSASLSLLAQGITYAADHGARVANMSFAASAYSTITSAAQYFQSKGGVVTISAGNSAIFDSTADNPYALTVSATDGNDALASWSNTGNLIDVAAPGVSVLTTTSGGGYGAVSGTSFSAPIVAGVAALVMSANPNLGPVDVQNVIKQSADDLGTAGWDAQCGYGRVNAARAVALAMTVTATDTQAPTVSFGSRGSWAVVGGTIVVQVNASDNVGVAAVSLSVDGQASLTLTAAPYSFAVNTTALTEGNHTLKATAKDAMGNTGTSSITVTVDNIPNQPPSVTITSPGNGGKVSKNVSVKVATASDSGMKKVDLYVDGNLTSSSSTAPYTTSWNANKAKSGGHSLQCVATDVTGLSAASPAVVVYK